MFGVTTGDTCYCGNSINSETQPFDDENCDSTCAGNARAGKPPTDPACGGSGYMSVYSKAYEIDLIPSGVTYTNIGCYLDAGPADALVSQDVFVTYALRIQMCEVLCENFDYFGLKGGNKCLCGDGISPDARIAAPATCSRQCDGDFSQVCGSDTANYQVLYAAPKFTACSKLGTTLRVRNPGFENGVAFWNAVVPTNTQWQSVSSKYHGGRRSARISSKLAVSPFIISQDLTLCPGTSYIFSYWSLGSACLVDAKFRSSTVSSGVGGDIWQRDQVYVTAPQEAASISFEVTCDGLTPLRQLYLDDIELRPATIADAPLFPN
jgi:hypothetical protein